MSKTFTALPPTRNKAKDSRINSPSPYMISFQLIVVDYAAKIVWKDTPANSAAII